jgi:hypothetical protein
MLQEAARAAATGISGKIPEHAAPAGDISSVRRRKTLLNRMNNTFITDN